MDKRSKVILWLTLGFSVSLLIIFFNRINEEGLKGCFGIIGYDKIGQFGDFFGGVIGTIISIAGFYFLYLTLKEQRESFETERLETKFFEMVKLFKENVNEMNYTQKHRITDPKSSLGTIEDIKNQSIGRKVFKVIYDDFRLLYDETEFLFQDLKVNEIYVDSYLQKLKKNSVLKSRKIDLIKYAHVDIVYCILFFGLNVQDRRALSNLFKDRYSKSFTDRIISYAALKPKEESEYYESWKNFQIPNFQPSFDSMYDLLEKRGVDFLSKEGHIELTRHLLKHGSIFGHQNFKYEKYYGGHQFRFGHYFRHIYQILVYIDKSTLSYREKYDNIKFLRSQMSTFEQRFVFLNSISSMGRAWELEKVGSKLEVDFNDGFITKYNFIKNIPDYELINGKIKISDYYPNVVLETDYDEAKGNARALIEKSYN